ncbi:MAG: DUF4230 domain-containing protein [Candidatus Krumholzibacteriia bacterium]|nr:DUF4230 domain-containing protein [Candidatus Latescibacterota bacterium]MCB9516769.1 DUF4230 domain-containing protein [Candidatus Latescibacterota bacterium]
MDTLLFGLVAGVLLAVIAMLALRRRRGGSGPHITASSSVEAFKSVGELVVLKVFTKQIVTSRDHLFGDWGEKWLAWLLSSKQTAMVFEFVVDFRYDLRHPAFAVAPVGDGGLSFTLPPPAYEIQMKDMQFYDERGAALVPLLLPDWIGRVFGGKFSEKEKNQLIKAARDEAEGLAKQLVDSMRHEVQKSAEATLSSMARGMGFAETRFLFGDAEPVRLAIDLSSIEASASRALAGLG